MKWDAGARRGSGGLGLNGGSCMFGRQLYIRGRVDGRAVVDAVGVGRTLLGVSETDRRFLNVGFCSRWGRHDPATATTLMATEEVNYVLFDLPYLLYSMSASFLHVRIRTQKYKLCRYPFLVNICAVRFRFRQSWEYSRSQSWYMSW